jgi:hypothetical protein
MGSKYGMMRGCRRSTSVGDNVIGKEENVKEQRL